MEPTFRTFKGFGGISIAADTYGDPSAQPVLFMHGGGQTRHAWGNSASALAEQGWYAVSVDLRGHGQSDWSPEGDYSPMSMGGDLMMVVDQIGRLPVGVGASMGGLICLGTQGNAPNDVLAGLVLVDIAPRMEREGVNRIVGFMTANPEGFASIEEAADAIASYLPNRPRPKDLSGLEKNLRRTPEGRYIWHWDPKMLSTAGAAAQASRGMLDEAARKVKIPTMLVRGRMSDIVSEQSVKEFLDLVPHAEYRDVSQAGHMVAGDRNDAFTQAVLDFLTRHFSPVSG